MVSIQLWDSKKIMNRVGGVREGGQDVIFSPYLYLISFYSCEVYCKKKQQQQTTE